MVILLSPSKTLESDIKLEGYDLSTPHYSKEATELNKSLKELSRDDIKKLMSISDKLVELNYARFHKYRSRHTSHNSNAAIQAFKGDVYTGFDLDTLKNEDILYANNHILILSGLYGILKPLDKMQPYRLEMGTTLKTGKGKNLYEFWGNKITSFVNKSVKKSESNIIVNLASNEYYKSIQSKNLIGELINIDFREDRNGELKFISFNAKKARGMMARFIIQHRITKKEDLKGFDTEGYHFSEDHSNDDKLLFIR